MTSDLFAKIVIAVIVTLVLTPAAITYYLAFRKNRLPRTPGLHAFPVIQAKTPNQEPSENSQKKSI